MGVTGTPWASFAGPKLCAGVRTSWNGSSLAGPGGAAGPALLATAADPFTALLAVALGAAAPFSEITATIPPTGATAPVGTRISARTPPTMEGTSIETLSVSISNR